MMQCGSGYPRRLLTLFAGLAMGSWLAGCLHADRSGGRAQRTDYGQSERKDRARNLCKGG